MKITELIEQLQILKDEYGERKSILWERKTYFQLLKQM